MTEYRPPVALQPYVQAYWAGTFRPSTERELKLSVVPHGCIELIVHLSDDHCFLNKSDRDWHHSPDFTLIGLYHEPYEVRFARPVETFCIRFFPEGITNVLGVPPARFLATYEDGTDVLGIRFRDYCRRLREADGLRARIDLTNAFLLKWLVKNRRDTDYTRRAAGIIRQQQGRISQEELANRVFISPRQLQRAFKQQYGMTTKQYMRLARFDAVQRYLQGQGTVDFSDAAYGHGFADQSHFIREFRAFTGRSPSAFLQERAQFIVNPDE